MDILIFPVSFAVIVVMSLADLGVINPVFGWVNGTGMTKVQSSQGHLILMHMFFMHLYTSRMGLGFIASLVIYTGVVLYSSFLWLILVLFPIWLSHMRQRLTRRRAE